MSHLNETALHFQRQAVAFRNTMQQSCAGLVGLVHGILADGQLLDAEITYLHDWLVANESLALSWPGSAILQRIRAAAEDGRIDPAERAHLQQTLEQLIGGTLEEAAASAAVCQLAIDEVEGVELAGRVFVLTGDFAYGPRASCIRAINQRGGEVAAGVTKKTHYVVVGGLGSPEWKHGSFGSKIERAMQLKQQGHRLLVVHEDALTASMFG